MINVIGEFTATVSVPIAATIDIVNALNAQNGQPSTLTFTVKGSEVHVSLGDLTEPASPEDDEFPEIKSFKVLVTRQVNVQVDSTGKETLSRDDEEEFERIMIEAVRRVVTGIKKRTRQASIDTRRPVGGYRCSYDREDGTKLKAEFPTEPGSYKLPQYALASLPGLVTPPRRHQELNKAMWAELQGEVHSPVALSLYDELIHDAAVLQRAMRYEQAALSAAIAVEIMLPKICSALLRRKGLHNEQIKVLLPRQSNKKLGQIFRTLGPSDDRLHEDVKSLIDVRNDLVHEASRGVDPKRGINPKRMTEVINTSYTVRRILDDYEQLSEEGG